MIKEYLESVRKAEKALWLIKQEQEHAMEVATRLSGQSETHIRTPGVRSPTEMAGIRLADLSTELQTEVERYVALIEDARRLIGKIPQERFREVLTLRYLCGHAWKIISAEMHYADSKSVYRVHGWALREAQRIYDEMAPNAE